jgi:beta-lactamase superfamily II metal-dependent hydrolase
MANCLAVCTLGGTQDRTLDIYWVDSQGGGSTLIVTPNNESLLIDTGNPGGRDSSRIHQVATQVAGLKRIDHLVTTHFHIDHFGGAPELADLMPIGEVYDNGLPERDPDNGTDPTWPAKSRGYRQMKCDRRIVVLPGAGIPLRPVAGGPRLSATFLAAREQFAGTPAPKAGAGDCPDSNPRPADTSDNRNSVATVVQFGKFRFYDGGDMTWNTEAALACPGGRFEPVDVFQVNHHGLDVSNHPLLLKALAPTVAVFNNGPHKGGALAVTTQLRSLPSLRAIYQVHRNLDSAPANTPAPFIANTDETGGKWLKLSVAGDGLSYTFTVPATSHSATYRTRDHQIDDAR